MSFILLVLAVLLAFPIVWLVGYLVDEKEPLIVEAGMFSTKLEDKPTGPIAAENVLTADVTLEGQLHSNSNICFDGEVTGDLSTEADLFIDQHGKVKGNVTGRNVVVAGAIQGDITADRLEILSTGRVLGDIMVGALVIDEGGIFRGRSSVHADEILTTVDASQENVIAAEPTYR